MRGIPPVPMVAVAPQVIDVGITQYGAEEDLCKESLRAFTDGSGGKFNRSRDLRRCGWSWVVLNAQGDGFF